MLSAAIINAELTPYVVVLPRKELPRGWGKALRVHEWASRVPHEVVRGQFTRELSIVRLDGAGVPKLMDRYRMELRAEEAEYMEHG